MRTLENGAYQRNPNRITYRNGYYDCDYTTQLGTLNLRVPRTRDRKFLKSLKIYVGKLIQNHSSHPLRKNWM